MPCSQSRSEPPSTSPACLMGRPTSLNGSAQFRELQGCQRGFPFGRPPRSSGGEASFETIAIRDTRQFAYEEIFAVDLRDNPGQPVEPSGEAAVYPPRTKFWLVDYFATQGCKLLTVTTTPGIPDVWSRSGKSLAGWMEEVATEVIS